MNTARRLESLVTVQSRRVDAALRALKELNQRVQRALAERSACLERWQTTEDRRKQEMSRTETLGGGSQSVSAAELVAAAGRVEWWRERARERKTELESADAALLQTESEAAQASLRYRRAHARHEGLTKLADEQRGALESLRMRVEESDMDGRRAVGDRT
jgi:hypothetical protein